jgi:glycosyltransferase involved in cell wall biosynthesis
MVSRADGLLHNGGMRVAWFSPLPPDPSGIAAYSAEVTPLLRPHLRSLDLYGPDSADVTGPGRVRTQDFVWRHRRDPYDLIVYQMGNSPAHDFMWGYLFRYPGLLVLHDAQVHQARALHLLQRLTPRLDDYLDEIGANHPGVPADLGHLVAAGLGGSLFRLWPLVSLLIRASRLTLVHNAHLARQLSDQHPEARVDSLEMGVEDPRPDPATGEAARRAVRDRHAIPADAVVVGAYGGVTPEKRIPQLLAGLAGPLRRLPVHLLLVGQRMPHYDVDAQVRRLGLSGRVHITGYVPDALLPDYLAAADIGWCLRWPSNGETSASWLRCLAAGQPTLVTALAQIQDVPLIPASSLPDRQTDRAAIGVAIDPVEEAAELTSAIAWLAGAPDTRRAMGERARHWWATHHTLPAMAEAYRAAMTRAAAAPVPHLDLPAHLVDEGAGTVRRILGEMGISELRW